MKLAPDFPEIKTNSPEYENFYRLWKLAPDYESFAPDHQKLLLIAKTLLCELVPDYKNLSYAPTWAIWPYQDLNNYLLLSRKEVYLIYFKNIRIFMDHFDICKLPSLKTC